jgi:phosphoribosyl 1,2-cyclic phosphodiesterase
MTTRIRFSVLASGSGGNACYVETRGARILIDAGLTLREMERRLAAVGVSPHRLDGIVLTHEHADHVRGAGPLARRYGLPLFLNAGTLKKGRKVLGRLPDVRLIVTGDSVAVNDLVVETFTKCHDAGDPMGVVMASDGVRIGVATDLGRSTRLVEERLKGCQALILEFNHDPDMLDQGPYPLFLKRRIKGPDGHLSNREGGELLRALSHAGLKTVVLAHLSATNNHPEKAQQAATLILEACGLRATGLWVADQDTPGPIMEV